MDSSMHLMRFVVKVMTLNLLITIFILKYYFAVTKSISCSVTIFLACYIKVQYREKFCSKHKVTVSRNGIGLPNGKVYQIGGTETFEKALSVNTIKCLKIYFKMNRFVCAVI